MMLVMTLMKALPLVKRLHLLLLEKQLNLVEAVDVDYYYYRK